MARDYLTDDQVEKEIERLTQSREVRLVRQMRRLEYKKRQYLYQLRNMEKRGKELLASGIDEEVLKTQAHCLEEDM